MKSRKCLISESEVALIYSRFSPVARPQGDYERGVCVSLIRAAEGVGVEREVFARGAEVKGRYGGHSDWFVL